MDQLTKKITVVCQRRQPLRFYPTAMRKSSFILAAICCWKYSPDHYLHLS